MACQLSGSDGQKVMRRVSNRVDGGRLGLDRQIWSVFLLFQFIRTRNALKVEIKKSDNPLFVQFDEVTDEIASMQLKTLK